MELEDLYIKYRNLYVKANMMNFNREYVDSLTKSYFWLSIFYIIFSGILFLVDIILMGFVSSFMALLFYYRFYKTFKKNFLIIHSLDYKKRINFFYYDTKKRLLEEKDFINNIDNLISFSSLEIENDNTGFLYSPIIVITISFIMACFVNIMTSNLKDYPYLGIVIICLAIILILLGIYYSGQGKSISKNIRFKDFLLKIKFDLKHEKS